MSRQRTTWRKPDNQGSPRQAATSRRADLYTMNQDHPQPSPTDYENGSPDEWAETPSRNQNVEMDYDSDGRVRRNEIGMGEFRPDTWEGKDKQHWNDGKKYDNQRMAAERKAQAAETVAKALLRTTNQKLVQDQAVDLMALPQKALVATFNRIRQASPQGLSEESRYRRALACCKIAATIVSSESRVERVARSLMALDDSSLRDIIRVAAEEEEEKSEDHDAGMSYSGEHESMDHESGEHESMDHESMDHDASDCMSSEEVAMLDSLLQQEMGQPAAPAAPAAPAPSNALTDLFAEDPTCVDPMVVPAVDPMVAGDSPEINFDDEDSAGSVTASDSQILDNLFSDNPEVQAMQEIRASQQEQAAREQGYQVPGGRTASSKGARSLGRVNASKSGQSVDQQLESLWDRPGN